MLKFAANLTMLFTEVPFLDRFEAARDAGFKYIEFLLPYDYEAGQLADLLKRNNLTQALFNLPSGDWAGGDRGIAADPARVDEFRAGIGEAVRYAKALNVPCLNCLSGKLTAGHSEEAHWKTLISNIVFAADELAKHNLTLLVEGVNRIDVPNFFLHRTDLVLKAMDEANRPNVKAQYDIYHAQRTEGEIVNTLRARFSRIGHIQIADTPGRHQPGTGELNFPYIFRQLEQLGYQGCIGLEYVPHPDTLGSLGWIKEYGYGM